MRLISRDFSLLVAPAVCLLIGPLAAESIRAETSNGNDFALYYSEVAGKPDEQKALLDDARSRPHFFRYLQVMEMEDLSKSGGEGIRIVAFEPSSFMDVRFIVTKPVSLSVLTKDPATEAGDAIAVTGAVVDVKDNAILLDPVIVRHKDRLSPAVGKELLGEVDPGAVFYSYTAGPRPVKLTYENRDLLQHRDRILAEKGPAGWVEFLETELARRGNKQGSGNAP